MENQNRAVIISSFAVIVLVAGAFYFFSIKPSSLPSSQEATSTAATSTFQVGSSDSSAAPKGDVGAVPVTVEYERKGNWDAAVAPDYRAPIAFIAGVSEADRVDLNNRMQILVDRIAKNAHDAGAWISLATIHKGGGDYAFAEEVWAYMTKVFPLDPTAYLNLADLYRVVLQDYPKAETYYLKGIELLPEETESYRALFTMYAYKYKTESGNAESILKKGIAANPNAVDLMVTLAQYYREEGRIADAKAQFEAAASVAKSLGKMELAASIEDEKNSF